MSRQSLDHTLIDLASGLIAVTGDAPIELKRIIAELPMEFALDPGMQITARPPYALQSRDLALPVARMSVTFDLEGPADV